MKPSLEALLTLTAIVETGGLSPAARRLGIAKSVVSKRLAELERMAGAELIRRGGRKAVPTEAGEAFYLRAKRILAELDAALDESAGEIGELRGPIRLAAPLTFSRMYLADLFAGFAKAYPRVVLTLDCDDRRIDIRGGGYDLAIRIGRLEDSALIARKLGDIEAALVASPAYIAAHGAPQVPGELGQHAVIAYGNAAMPHQWRFGAGKDGSAQTVAVEPRLIVNSGELICAAAIAGLGIAQLPLFISGAALRRGELVRVLPDAPLDAGAINVVWLPRPAPSRRVRALIDLLASEVPKRLAAACAAATQ